MGWKKQGYYKDLAEPSLSYRWQVYGNGYGTHDIDKFQGYDPKLEEWAGKLEILYGTLGAEYFRGYVLTDSLAAAKKVLSSFYKQPVYKEKHGGSKKEFDTGRLGFIETYEVIVFYEMRRWTGEEWTDMLEELLHQYLAGKISPATADLISWAEPIGGKVSP